MTLIGWNSAAHELMDATVHAAHYDSKGSNSNTVGTQRNEKKDSKGIKGHPPAKNSKIGHANKSKSATATNGGLYNMSTMSGQGMVVIAIVIGLVSYSIKVLYSR